MIATFALILALQGHDEHPGGDRWFSVDKAKHFFVSAFVQSFAYSSLRTIRLGHGPALVSASAVSLAVGVAKELDDRKRGGIFSRRDLTWDAAGIVVWGTVLGRSR